MENQFALALLKGGYISVDKLRSKREVAGSQIEQGGHICFEQQFKGVGMKLGKRLNLLAPQGSDWPLGCRALNDAEPHTESPYGFGRREPCEFFESRAW